MQSCAMQAWSALSGRSLYGRTMSMQEAHCARLSHRHSLLRHHLIRSTYRAKAGQTAASRRGFARQRCPNLGSLLRAQAGQAAASSQAEAKVVAASAAEAALKYYESYNAKKMDKVLELIAEDCVYEGERRLICMCSSFCSSNHCVLPNNFLRHP
jgi:hypothetical protein